MFERCARDVCTAPTMYEVNHLLEATASGNDPVKIRDHAILSLLIHYGLRRGEVERRELDGPGPAPSRRHAANVAWARHAR
jgi:site-specific recombinase XerC